MSENREMKKVKHRSNQAQMKSMVDFMEQNPEFANGKSNDPEQVAHLWAKLAEKLNSVGEAKDSKGWIRTWNDLLKSAQQRRSLLHTGQRNTPVPELDFRVLAIAEKMTQQTVPDNASQSPTHLSRSNSGSAMLKEQSRRPANGSSYGYSSTSILSAPCFSNTAPRQSPVRSPIRSARQSPISPIHHIPHRSSVLSPHQSVCRSPVRSPHRSARRSPVPAPRRSARRSPHRSARRSPHHSAHRSPLRSPHRSTYRSPPCSPRSVHRSPMSARHHPAHRSAIVSPHHFGSRPGNRLTTRTEPVPVVDLTKRTAPSVPPCRKPQAAPVKGTSANTSAVIEAMTSYSSTVTACVTQAIKCFEDQNQILQNGFETLGRILEGAVYKLVCNLTEKRDSHSHRTFNERVTNQESEEMKRDDCDDEDKWPAEFLESELFSDDE